MAGEHGEYNTREIKIAAFKSTFYMQLPLCKGVIDSVTQSSPS